MRRNLAVTMIGLASVAGAVALIAPPSVASSSPFPPAIRTRAWNPAPGALGPAIRPGALVTLVKAGSTLCAPVAVARVEWSVWCDRSAQFPVKSVDGGHQWRVAGPLLANDWAGGSLYYVSKVVADSRDVVAMWGTGVIDTTFDGGRAWRQLATPLSMAGAWKMRVVRYEGGTGVIPYELVMHVVFSPTWASHRADSATYITRDRGQSWVRLSQHLG